MSPTLMLRRMVVVPALALAVACGGGTDDGGPAAEPCGTLPTADPVATLPAGLPPVDGQLLYNATTQGKTEVVFALLHESDFVAVRDRITKQIETAGWTIEGADQESVEAEAQFSKTSPVVQGSIKVEPYCEGYVVVRYRVSS